MYTVSCVVGRECLLWPVCSLDKTLLAFALLHFVQVQICLLLQISLDFQCFHSHPLWWTMPNQVVNIFHFAVVLVLRKNIAVCIPWVGTRTLPLGCTMISWPFLPSLSISSLPWLASVWTYPLDLRESHGSWSLLPTNKKWVTEKGFPG